MFLLLFLHISTYKSYSQNYQIYIDSLKTAVEFSEGKEKIKALLTLAFCYNGAKNWNEDIIQAQNARQLSIEYNYREAEAVATLLIGDAYNDLNQLDSAGKYSFKAIHLLRQLADTHNLILGYRNLSNFYEKLAMNDSMISYARIALTLTRTFSGNRSFPLDIPYENTDKNLFDISAITYMAHCFDKAIILDSAEKYYIRSIKYCEDINHQIHKANQCLYLARNYKFRKMHLEELQALKNGFEASLSDNDLVLWQAHFAYHLGYWHMLHGNYKEAIEYFAIAKSKYLESYKKTSIDKHYFFYCKQFGNIARSYLHWGNLDSALKYQKISLRLLQNCTFNAQIDIANQMETKGLILIKLGKFDSAIVELEASRQMRLRQNDLLGVGMCLDGLGEIFRLQGRYDTAICILNESVKTKRSAELSTKDPFPTYFQQESLSVTYLQLGHVFYNWGKYENALSYYDTSINICRDIGYVRGEVEAHQAMAEIFIQTSQTQLAIQQLQEALKLARQIANKPYEALVMQGMASVFQNLNQPDSALQYYNSSIEILEGHKYLNDLPDILLQSGLLHLQLRQLGEAYDDLNRSISLAKKSGQTKTIMQASKVLSGIYFNAANYKRAYEYLDAYTRLKDAVFQIETHKQLAEMQAKHQTQQKQQQIELLENKNNLNELQIRQSRYVNFSLGGLILFVLLFAILFMRQIKIRNEQKALVYQQQLLRSQINPHFIFNSLTNIQNFIFKNDSLSAGKYLSSFAKLMRNILDNSREERIPIDKEVETLQQYLELQKLRMGEKLEYEFIVDKDIDTSNIIVPPMLAQPFIENAVEHGIRHKEGKGRISIEISQKNSVLEFVIEDDGIGRKKAQEKEKGKKHRSLAMKITRERLEAMKKKTRQKILFSIEDLYDDKGNAIGTRVVFGVPVRT